MTYLLSKKSTFELLLVEFVKVIEYASSKVLLDVGILMA